MQEIHKMNHTKMTPGQDPDEFLFIMHSCRDRLSSSSIYSTIAPPHASDGFKVDSTPFSPSFFIFLLVRPVHVYSNVNASLSRVFVSIWPPVTVNILHFLVHAVDSLGVRYRRNTQVHNRRVPRIGSRRIFSCNPCRHITIVFKESIL